jgi:hypothetical protein
MDSTHIALAGKASSLFEAIQVQVAKLMAMEEAIAAEDRLVAGPSTPRRPSSVASTSVSSGPAVSTPVSSSAPGLANLGDLSSTGGEVQDQEDSFKDFGPMSDDEDVTSLRVAMDMFNVNKMLINSVRPSTLSKYSRLWDKWLLFAALHGVDIMPPDMRALEIFVVDTAELSGSCGVASSAAAAVAHFCALEGFPSPFV